MCPGRTLGQNGTAVHPFKSTPLDQFVRLIANLRQRGVPIAVIAITSRTHHTAAVGRVSQVENAVVGKGIEAFDGTGVHLQQGNSCHEGAKGDVHLVAGPALDLLAADGVVYLQKFPGLQAIARWSLHLGILQGRPGGGVNAATGFPP